MRIPLRAAAFGALAALVAATGTAVHLLAEVAGAGVSTFAASRHTYLLGILALALLSLVGAVAHAGIDRRSASLLVRALPGGGRGIRYTAGVGLAQFAFFAATAAGEGAPLAGAHLVLGLVVAAVASALGALVVAAFAARIIEAVAGIAAPLSVADRRPPAFLSQALPPPLTRKPYVLFRPKRPPPAILASHS